jgi:hypothetical protein
MTVDKNIRQNSKLYLKSISKNATFENQILTKQKSKL